MKHAMHRNGRKGQILDLCLLCGSILENGEHTDEWIRIDPDATPKFEPKLYRSWVDMRVRCNQKRGHKYKWYGGRGIRVDKRWNRYSVFRAWSLENGYGPGLTLDRIDNDGNYCPENCRWADRFTQAANRPDAKLYTFRGETLPIGGWARKLGMDRVGMRYRLRNWPLERALTEPPQTRRKIHSADRGREE